MQAQLIQLVRRNTQQRCHLINKRTGSAGTGTIHAFLQPAGEKNDFGVLSAQLHNDIGIRYKPFHRTGRGKDLLHKFQLRRFCHAQAGRTRDRDLNHLSLPRRKQSGENFGGFFPHLGHVPLVCLKNRIICIVQQYNLDRGRAYVDPYTQPVYPPYA